ncbi:MAG: hypothetical protein H6Q95_530, partial [Nitrospirae bacterium]|nr:hypothetical protein [Nitrospirota bacterium]
MSQMIGRVIWEKNIKTRYLK